MTRASALLALALGALILIPACGGGQRSESTVFEAAGYDFASARTFNVVQLAAPEGLSTGNAAWAARYDAALTAALRDELVARGLTEVELGQPVDLAFTFAYGGAERRVQAVVGQTIQPITATEAQLVFQARDGDDLDAVVWSNTVDVFLQEEWPPIERAEANAPSVVADIMAPFPVEKPGDE